MFKSIPVVILFLFALMSMGALALVGPQEDVESEELLTEAPVREFTEASNVVLPKKKTQAVAEKKEPSPQLLWNDYPNVCESFTVIEGQKLVKNRRGEKVFPVRHRRNRFDRRRSDQRRTAQLVRMVAQEMGADVSAQYLVGMIAHHEASYNSEAIHILNRDLEANQKAWTRHSYSAPRERDILMKLETASKKDNRDGYYRLKAALADLRMYKGNTHWRDKLEYSYVIPERSRGAEVFPESSWDESRSVWAFGYGLYGMNAVLFTHVWDKTAPPWILCGDEGIVATVTAIWALRRQQENCQALSKQNSEKWGDQGGSIKGILHRWGHGQCGNGRPGKAWRKLLPDYAAKVAKRYGDKYTFEWETVPDFGNKFERFETYRRGGKLRWKKDENGKRIPTDRMAVLEHMRKKAEEKGLLREEPLKRKKSGTEPRIIAGGTVPVVAVR
jgi:hypothetical protein